MSPFVYFKRKKMISYLTFWSSLSFPTSLCLVTKCSIVLYLWWWCWWIFLLRSQVSLLNEHFSIHNAPERNSNVHKLSFFFSYLFAFISFQFFKIELQNELADICMQFTVCILHMEFAIWNLNLILVFFVCHYLIYTNFRQLLFIFLHLKHTL